MKSLLVVCMLLSLASAWWDHGHLLTARIAQKILEDEDPGTYEKVLSVLQTLKDTDPNWTQNEEDHPFTECATYADFIKGKTEGKYQQGWHFIDEPFLDEGGQISDFNFTFDDHNITEVVKSLTDWFKGADGYKDTYEYKQIMSHTYKDHTETNGLSTAMRFIIHYVGDLHQPLHSTTRVNSKYPKGDFGGNLVYLPDREGAKNLHSVWDSVGYEYTGYANLPFSDSDWQNITETATMLMGKFDISESEASELDVKVWAKEAFEYSKTHVYPTIEKNKMPSEEYIQNCRDVAERQVVLGGHRLARMLQSLNLQAPEEPKSYMERFGEYFGISDELNQVYDFFMKKIM